MFVIVTFSLSNVTVAITFWFVNSFISYVIVAFGKVLSIFVTVAVAVPAFPALSTKLNVNVPLSVNVYVLFPSLFVIVTFSSLNVIVAIISWFVLYSALYFIVATGAILSIQSTVAVAVPAFPAGPINSNSNVPLSVLLPLLFLLYLYY